MFVLPSFFLIITLVGLAIALVFAGRVEHSARRGLEKGMILAAIVAIMCVCLLVSFLCSTWVTHGVEWDVDCDHFLGLHVGGVHTLACPHRPFK